MLNVYLPGFSERNADEQRLIVKAISKQDWKVYSRSWDHWYDPSLEFNLEREVALMEKVLQSLRAEEVVLIGKSIGTIVAADLAGKIQPRRLKAMILIAPPVQDTASEAYSSLVEKLSKFEVPKKIMVHEEDEVSPISAMLELAKAATMEMQVLPGKGHHYLEIDLLINELVKYNLEAK